MFAPDIFDGLKLTVQGHEIEAAAFTQTYALAGGRAVGTYQDGSIAAIENEAGAGKTLLIGTFPSLGFFNHHSQKSRDFFRSLLAWTGKFQRVVTSNPGLIARLHEGGAGKALWALNTSRSVQNATISLPLDAALDGIEIRWGDAASAMLDGGTIKISVPARDAVVMSLR